jgi:hypothetical protein
MESEEKFKVLEQLSEDLYVHFGEEDCDIVVQNEESVNIYLNLPNTENYTTFLDKVERYFSKAKYDIEDWEIDGDYEGHIEILYIGDLMSTIIFGVVVVDYLTIIIILCAINLFFFISFLFGKEEIKLDNYFKTLFNVYSRTKLRKFWGALLFTFMYFSGIVYLIFIKIAWYPAKWLRQLIKFVFYNSLEL